ncbi:hypothetical protein IL306_013146 [Fusarium sp. DS 682]|nr:hypothetical protein IL306_013146 [Fusarium sp. DS 682]
MPMIEINNGILQQQKKQQQQQHEASSALQNLPPEVLIEIMLRLPHSSLYLLQQTCKKIRQISERDTFKAFNLEFRDGQESYCISEEGYQQRQILRDILVRKTLCHECNAYRDSGKLHQVMKKLYQTRYCQECRFDHPDLFFSPEEKKKERSQCLGRIGHFPLCSHESLRGPDMVTLTNVGGKEEHRCYNLSHKLSTSRFEQHSLPHVYLFSSVNWHESGMKHHLRFAVDATAHLVVIDGCSKEATEEAIRQIRSGSYTVSDTSALCKHFSSKILDECLASDSSKCSCFPRSEEGLHKCTILDQRPSAICKICRAQYHLSLRYDSRLQQSRGQTLVDLSVTREFLVKNFLSPSWLFNLNYNQDKECHPRLKRNPLLNEETKHVLWCDNPGCATGSECRWERMALTYLNDAYENGELHDGCDYGQARDRDMGWLSLEYDVFHGSKGL